MQKKFDMKFCRTSEYENKYLPEFSQLFCRTDKKAGRFFFTETPLCLQSGKFRTAMERLAGSCEVVINFL